ncbi:MAG: thermonuclease family protein [Nitrospirota bacterium]|nr:thermonuclease family protein [Nitrospirota bacterium]
MIQCRKAVSAVLFISIVSFCILSSAYSGEQRVVRGTVTRVVDGDTVIVRPDIAGGRKLTCRLYGIDAPETPKRGRRGQEYGREADRVMRNLVLGCRVDATLTGDKTYNRDVCIIKKDGMDINREMVSRGYAWAYRRYLKGPYASEYIDAESRARAMRLGLWQQSNPQPPWEFRRGR